MDADRPLGLILAGGQARRLGGVDKALVQVGGRSLLARVAERLAPQCHGLVLSANGLPARFGGWNGPVVPDHSEDRGQGPLAGLLAGLDFAAGRGASLVLTIPCDAPFLPLDLAARLTAARLSGAAVAYARSGGREHPLAALWPVAFRHRLQERLRTGHRRVRDLLAEGAVAVDWPAEPADPFFNVNTPEDVVAAEHRAARELAAGRACAGGR